MNYRFILTFYLLAAGPALATPNMEAMQTAASLGSVLASEQACGLTFDQAAIQAYIAATVPADAMEFPSTLAMMTQGSAMQMADMSASAKTAHCAAISQTARHYGFIQ